jgi:fibronectin type 3 domain-containing protein
MRRFTLCLIIVWCLSLWAGTVSAAAIRLTWTAVTQNTDDSTITDLDHYNVYRCTDSGGGCTPSTLLGPSGTNSYTDSTVGSQTTVYRYEVTAVNTNGTESARSNQVRARWLRRVIIRR